MIAGSVEAVLLTLDNTLFASANFLAISSFETAVLAVKLLEKLEGAVVVCARLVFKVLVKVLAGLVAVFKVLVAVVPTLLTVLFAKEDKPLALVVEL